MITLDADLTGVVDTLDAKLKLIDLEEGRTSEAGETDSFSSKRLLQVGKFDIYFQGNLTPERMAEDHPNLAAWLRNCDLEPTRTTCRDQPVFRLVKKAARVELALLVVQHTPTNV